MSVVTWQSSGSPEKAALIAAKVSILYILFFYYLEHICSVAYKRVNLFGFISSSAILSCFIPTEPAAFHCNLNVEEKLAKNFLLLIAAWTIAWTPYAVVSLVGLFGYGHLISVSFTLRQRFVSLYNIFNSFILAQPYASMITALFAKLASCTDPFLYSLNNPQIKEIVDWHLKKISRLLSGNILYRSTIHHQVGRNLRSTSRLPTILVQRFGADTPNVPISSRRYSTRNDSEPSAQRIRLPNDRYSIPQHQAPPPSPAIDGEMILKFFPLDKRPVAINLLQNKLSHLQQRNETLFRSHY